MRTWFMFSISCLIWGQPQITTQQNWEVGDAYHPLTPFYTERAFEDLAPGPKLTWDYSFLRADENRYTRIEFVDPQSTPHSELFPKATIARVQLEEDGTLIGFTYFEIVDMQVAILGSVFPQTQSTVIYKKTHKQVPVPFRYGDVFQGISEHEVNTNGTITKNSTSYETIADAWGTLQLPSGSFSCLRLKTSKEVIQSKIVNGAEEISKRTQIGYYWYSPDHKGPILTIGTSSKEVSGTVFDFSFTTFRDVQEERPANIARFLPHVTSPSGGFETKITFFNDGEDADLKISPVNQGGTDSESLDFFLPEKTTRTLSSTELFGQQDISHLDIMGPERIAISAAYQSSLGGVIAHIPLQTATHQQFFVYPGEPDLVFDGMAIINRGTEQAEITVEPRGTQNPDQVWTSYIAPNEKQLLVFESFFQEPPPLIEVKSTQRAQATFLRGSKFADPPILFVNEVQRVLSGQRWIPHITRNDAGFKTRILVHNTSDKPGRVSLHPYFEDGNSTDLVKVDIEPFEFLNFSKEELFGELDISHLAITGSQDIIVSASYKTDNGQGASAHTHQTQSTGKFFTIFPGDKSLVFDGLAIVNLQSTFCQIKAELIGPDGQILATDLVAENLKQNAKALKVFQFHDSSSQRIRISASSPCVAVFLRGTLGTQPAFLFTNPFEVGK